MIPPSLTRNPLTLTFLLLALNACIPRDDARLAEKPQPVPASAAAPQPWKKIAEREGWSFLKIRQEGVVNLLIYGGLKDGVKESGDAVLVMDAGWDVLTLSPNVTEGSVPGDRALFFEFALGQPGYRRKILVASGADLAAVVRLRPDTLAGLVIIRPGDAGFPTPEVRTLLSELPDNLPVLLLFAADENPAAYHIASLLRSQNKQIRLDASVGTDRILDGRILNFMHSLRYQSEFIESRKTFRKGCRLTANGAWVIAHVSGERADGYCPLLLRFGTDTYRAVGVLKDAACDYGITSMPAIRCY